jgi:hypothetical protein
MVLREWGEIQELEKACWKRLHRAILAPSKIRCYWYVWATFGLFLLASYFFYFPRGVFGFTLTSFFLSFGLTLLTGGLMYFVRGTAIATEFKDEYVTHGIAQFPRWRWGKYLHYALFLRGLAERGYTRETVRKLKDFAPVAGRPAPDSRLLQHPTMVPILTIGTVLTIEAIKQSETWKTSEWWLFFVGLIPLGIVIALLLSVSQTPTQLSRTRQQFLQWAELDIEDEQFLRTQRLRTQAHGPHGPSH